jgi:hypothetical protein
MSALLDELRHITGAAHVFTDGDLSAFTQDWRRRAHGKALAVVRPGSTDEVAAIVKACARHQAATGVSLVPQGGNTGLAVGSVPDSTRPAGGAEPDPAERGARHRRRQPDHHRGGRLRAAERAGGCRSRRLSVSR